MGLMAGLHANNPRAHSQWVAGSGRTPQGRAVGRERGPNTGGPTPRQQAPCPGHPPAAPQRAKPARKSTCCGVGDGSPRPHSPHTQPVGSGPQPHAPRTGRRAWESARTPDAPHQGKRRPALGALVPPHSAQSQHTNSGLPAGGRATPSKARGRRDHANPQRAKKAEHGTGAGNEEGHQPPRWAPPPPRTGTARSAPATSSGRGGGHVRRGSTSAHTRNRHVTRTQRATGPSRGTHRTHGMAYQQAK